MKAAGFLLVASCLQCCVGWQGKNTIAASKPLEGLAFALKYLPVTVAEDNGDGDVDFIGTQTWVQGRASVLLNGNITTRNCQLFSSKGKLSQASQFQSAQSHGIGRDCSYSNGSMISGTKMHSVFAYNRKQCCNACVATDGCVASTFLTSKFDKSGMGNGPLDHNWEGFAIHMAAVSGNTTGGLPVDQLESHYRERLGNLTAYDQFMDYSTTFYTHDLQPYAASFKKDGVPFFLAEWREESTQELWYSLIFVIPNTMYVIELASPVKPDSTSGTKLPRIEARMSPEVAAKFRGYQSHPANVLWVASINRASSNMSAIEDVYINDFKALLSFQSNNNSVAKRCYKMSEQSATDSNTFFWNQVCFTSRIPDPEKDRIFSVLDFERMLWAAHAGTLGNDPFSQLDKYTDNHDGLLMNPLAITELQKRFAERSPYPITADTRLAYLCKQSYLIDPTGWSIMPIPSASWPGCDGVPPSPTVCENYCDVTEQCGSPAGAPCSALVEKYSCADYYAPGKEYAGWCDKECGYGLCDKGLMTLDDVTEGHSSGEALRLS